MGSAIVIRVSTEQLMKISPKEYLHFVNKKINLKNQIRYLDNSAIIWVIFGQSITLLK